MRALRYHKDGGLKVEDVPRPAQPEGNDVLIQVKATAITKGELEWPSTKARECAVPGHDVAGVIEVEHPHPSDNTPNMLTGFRTGCRRQSNRLPSRRRGLCPNIFLPRRRRLRVSARLLRRPGHSTSKPNLRGSSLHPALSADGVPSALHGR